MRLWGNYDEDKSNEMQVDRLLNGAFCPVPLVNSLVVLHQTEIEKSDGEKKQQLLDGFIFTATCFIINGISFPPLPHKWRDILWTISIKWTDDVYFDRLQYIIIIYIYLCVKIYIVGMNNRWTQATTRSGVIIECSMLIDASWQGYAWNSETDRRARDNFCCSSFYFVVVRRIKPNHSLRKFPLPPPPRVPSNLMPPVIIGIRIQ